ncbi:MULTISPECIES: nitrate/nitrite transporter [Micromonospora]|uniref:NarK/NasA family nitrate transporter n=1 Tax=Micromonospora solifontis TaxID=2487138 RepID=A0ABX9WJE7_9ACTN|nr:MULTISPECIES: MFS transporter [Micromonospora]NES13843.1 NarK/NasA family nitrate transporter [Micromonospora sp. PPF5-17B]NES37065.1 NarK/NasA family nitrate transporter [Micromonospora solifontis]NES58326.1 NarK/NasA family nitrate transporter [Micromonospora sp. PPF5-6]RNL98735.1 NarK/NasA family nitrate transporter [Micromonospora solifontis]
MTMTRDRQQVAGRPAAQPAGGGVASLQLAIATLGFLVNFWAWALLGPLGPGIKERLGLSFAAQSLLVAVPVVVGSLGRVPIGALTDRYGARLVFPLVTLATIVPVLTLTVVSSYAALIVTGFFLGIGGTAFAVGVPHVSAWYPPARRGFAIGVFGVGMGGTAIANFTTVRLADAYGDRAPFLLVAAILAGYAVLAFLLLRDAPGRVRPTGSAWQRLAGVGRLTVTWQLCFLYAVGFGGFVAFSVYLPAYLRTTYELSPADGALRTAGFVVLAVAARPLGGWLSDRLHPVPVLVWCFALVATLAVVQAFEPPLMPVATVALLGMAALLGAASGAVFALVGKVAPAEQVGAVTGLVGAAGGLGGFVPPLVMGWVYGVQGSYAIGLMLLSDVALAAAVFTAVKMSGLARRSG